MHGISMRKSGGNVSVNIPAKLSGLMLKLGSDGAFFKLHGFMGVCPFTELTLPNINLEMKTKGRPLAPYL